MMLEREDAKIIRDHALTAIRELMTLLYFSAERCSPEQHEKLKRGVGLSVGKIQMEILEFINEEYPELDDLLDVPPENTNQ